MRDISSQAVWSLSGAKLGNGVDQLLDDNVSAAHTSRLFNSTASATANPRASRATEEEAAVLLVGASESVRPFR